MLSRKFTLLLAVSAVSVAFACACGGRAEKLPYLAAQGEGGNENTVTVYVLTRYELTEVVADYSSYGGWVELIEEKFDDSLPRFARAEWRGEYVTAIGNLRTGDPADICVYLNGEYSSRFVSGCEYAAGYTLSFVESSVAKRQ